MDSGVRDSSRVNPIGSLEGETSVGRDGNLEESLLVSGGGGGGGGEEVVIANHIRRVHWSDSHGKQLAQIMVSPHPLQSDLYSDHVKSNSCFCTIM